MEVGHYVHEPLVPGSSCSLSGCTLHGAMLGSIVGTCCAFWKAFFVKANSFLDVDTRPALLGPRYAVWRSAHSFCFGLLGLHHSEIWT